MRNKDILAALDLGSSIAENDENLSEYFVPIGAVQDFVNDRYDVIRGVKGSGKSAILRITSAQQQKYPELADVKFVIATEHTGEPAFKRAFERLPKDGYTEAELVNSWKVYLLNLALDALDGFATDEAKKAINLAEVSGIRYRDQNLFKKLWWSLLRMLNPKNVTIGSETLSAEFPDQPPEFWLKKLPVDFPEILRATVAAFQKANLRYWILLDRLDAAFQADVQLEKAALRAILIAYKDFMGHRNLRIKLFFRTDLFDVVTTEQGFRELTHVSDRTSPPLSWDSDKLLLMIMERFIFNKPIREKYGYTANDLKDAEDRLAAFLSICPQQVDAGERRPDSWNWVCNRLRDGNGVSTPRDLQVLMKNAGQKQIESLALGGEQETNHLLDGSSLKKGLAQLSEDKIRTSLIAENAHLEKAIRLFARGKAEHNSASLETMLGRNWSETVRALERIGFLEKLGDTNWKVPMIYRDGLEITQGAAFDK